jgi:hypothetical protein
MRSTLFALALAVVVLAFVGAPDARAQYYYGPGYSPYGYYYDPGLYYAPSYSYVPPYSWYGNYYAGPRYAGWSYGAYSPYTNTYFYQYRNYPRRWRWR